jgi:hypothetical protein
MKDYLATLVRESRNPTQSRNIVREYLQARILGILQRRGAMVPLAFQGGTALRFLFSIPRFSEDLDFSLERPDANYNFWDYLRAVEKMFLAEGYNLNLKISDLKIVHSAFIRFYGLLYELNLSMQPGEALSVKIEIDTRPPIGAGLTTTLIRRYETLHLQHHDRASLLAGKMHAILQRSFVKGRDLYDIIWYLSDPNWPSPNLRMLNNALQQTKWDGPELNEQNWRTMLWERLKGIKWDRVQSDVQPFLEHQHELSLLTKENLSQLLMHNPNR